MSKHETYFLASNDGLQLFGQSWVPEQDPVAVVLMVHGFGEHCSRYASWAGRFVEKNMAFCTFDHRGHGRSGGRRGDMPGYDSMINDLDLFYKNLLEKFPAIPLILYGHSFGGNVAVNFYLRRSPAVNAIILSSPWLKLAYELKGWKKMMADGVYYVYPSLVQSNGLKAEYISHDAVEVEKYKSDPLNHDRIAIRSYVYIRDAGKYAVEHASEMKAPTLVMHGSGDKITSFETSREFVAKAGPVASFKEWNGLYHETHNEPEKEQVFDFIFQWIKNQI